MATQLSSETYKMWNKTKIFKFPNWLIEVSLKCVFYNPPSLELNSISHNPLLKEEKDVFLLRVRKFSSQHGGTTG